jgi:hypothetical protein
MRTLVSGAGLEGGALIRDLEYPRFAHHWGFTPCACRRYRCQTKARSSGRCVTCAAIPSTAAPSCMMGISILADLRMPGTLEALDAIVHGVDGGTLTAPEAIEQLLSTQIQLCNKSAAAGDDALQPPARRQAAPRRRLHVSALAPS